jgi:hypothetical protein
MNMIRNSGSTCRLTLETADSSGSAAVVRAEVKMVSSFGRSGDLIERNAAHSKGRSSVPKRVIRCLTTVYRAFICNSNAVFTLQMCLYHRTGNALSPNEDEYLEFELGCLMT